ncbi:hypothetical protein [Streptomyces beigongshangae]|uniref:hypothetical protein n=1 Tax=Streptomyces beigongshangae TaxID=2841597 RepID=UPI0021A5629E|nr:hypothetical protein [Streptomyces sp. REN17]
MRISRERLTHGRRTWPPSGTGECGWRPSPDRVRASAPAPASWRLGAHDAPAGARYGDGGRTGCWSHTERALLTYDQVRAYGLPATEGKHDDPRWPAFARRYGFDPARPVQREVEALEPAELQRLVLAAVDLCVDQAVLTARIVQKDRQRRRLEAFVDTWEPDRSPPAGSA